MSSLAVEPPAEGGPVAHLPAAMAPPPPGYGYPPPGYAYPPPGYGYPPPYAYAPYAPMPVRPGLGVMAILTLVANYGGLFVTLITLAVGIGDGPPDPMARFAVIVGALVSSGALLAGSIGIHKARTWGAIMSAVIWALLAILMFAVMVGEENDHDAQAGLAMFGFGGLVVVAFALLSISQLAKVRAWQPPLPSIPPPSPGALPR